MSQITFYVAVVSQENRDFPPSSLLSRQDLCLNTSIMEQNARDFEGDIS